MKLFFMLAIFGLLFVVGISTTLVDIPTFDGNYLECITLKGDAFQAQGGINITDNMRSKYGTDISAGALLLKYPVSSHNLKAFQTEFSFVSTKPSSTSQGEGLAFFLSPSSSAGIPVFPFGLPSRFLAIVFDNTLSSYRDKTVLNSIEVLVDNITPIAKTDGVVYTLNNGVMYTVWVAFTGKTMSIYLSDSKLMPAKPILEFNSTAIRAFIEQFEKLYLGFSSRSIVGSQEHHKIYNWKVEVTDLQTGFCL